MKLIYLECTLIILFTFSCKDKELSELYDLSKAVYVNTETRSYVSNSCFTTSFIYDSLLVFKAECDDNIFHIFNKNTLDRIHKFGEKGRAPFEFHFPFPYISNTTSLDGNSVFLFYDLNLYQNKAINFSKIIQGYDLGDCITSELIDKNLIDSDHLNILDNGSIAGIDISSPNGIFYIYDSITKIKQWVSYDHKFELEDRYYKSVYQGLMASGRGVIIFAYKYIDEILVFDLTGNLLKKYNFSKLLPPKLSTSFTGVDHDAPIFFSQVYATPSTCMFLRLNRSIQDITNSDECIHLIELDWSGEIVNVYKTHMILGAFCLDNESRTLYGIDVKEYHKDEIPMLKIRLN